ATIAINSEDMSSFYMVKILKHCIFKYNILIHTLAVYWHVFINLFRCTHYIITLDCETRSSFQIIESYIIEETKKIKPIIN
ncbi:hypothetical protein COA26_31960, partial [Bacillus cereus]